MYPVFPPSGVVSEGTRIWGVRGGEALGHLTQAGGRVLYVNPGNAAGGAGFDPGGAFATLQAAIDEAEAGDTIWLAPGEYAEAVTISRTDAHANLTIIGAGGRGAAYIAAPTNGVALTNHADDLTLVNVGCEGDGTGGGLVNTGARLRAYGCKFEGGALAVSLTLGTVAQEAAGTRGRGADVLLQDCEVAWATRGVRLTCTDYGAVTQAMLKSCRFHNLDTAHVDESVGSGGSAAVTYRNLQLSDCLFDRMEDGTIPTAFLKLDASNDNTGIVTRCSFPTAISSGDNAVSSKLIWTSNFHTGGVSDAQPS